MDIIFTFIFWFLFLFFEWKMKNDVRNKKIISTSPSANGQRKHIDLLGTLTLQEWNNCKILFIQQCIRNQHQFLNDEREREKKENENENPL